MPAAQRVSFTYHCLLCPGPRCVVASVAGLCGLRTDIYLCLAHCSPGRRITLTQARPVLPAHHSPPSQLPHFQASSIYYAFVLPILGKLRGG